MLHKRALATLLALSLAFPVWADPNVVGSVASSQSATVRGTDLTPGSTIFSGDTIEVGPGGSLALALTGGAQVRLAENSQVRLARTAEKIQLTMDRGLASFGTTEKSPLEALLADATIRSADAAPAVGLIQVRSPQSAIIAAEKGALLISTTHDSGSVTLREGEGAEVTLAQEKTQDQEKDKKKRRKGGAPLPAGASSPKRVLIIVAILSGVATGIGIGLNRNEPNRSTTQNCNEVSPFRCP